MTTDRSRSESLPGGVALRRGFLRAASAVQKWTESRWFWAKCDVVPFKPSQLSSVQGSPLSHNSLLPPTQLPPLQISPCIQRSPVQRHEATILEAAATAALRNPRRISPSAPQRPHNSSRTVELFFVGSKTAVAAAEAPAAQRARSPEQDPARDPGSPSARARG